MKAIVFLAKWVALLSVGLLAGIGTWNLQSPVGEETDAAAPVAPAAPSASAGDAAAELKRQQSASNDAARLAWPKAFTEGTEEWNALAAEYRAADELTPELFTFARWPEKLVVAAKAKFEQAQVDRGQVRAAESAKAEAVRQAQDARREAQQAGAARVQAERAAQLAAMAERQRVAAEARPVAVPRRVYVEPAGFDDRSAEINAQNRAIALQQRQIREMQNQQDDNERVAAMERNARDRRERAEFQRTGR